MEIFAELLINVLASVVLLGSGFLVGKYRERRQRGGRSLEEYDFYPFGLDENKVLFFDTDKFDQGVRHFLKHRDVRAARQMVIIGQQNLVEQSLTGDQLARYRRFYARYAGDKILDDTARWLENYRRIVRLIGESFPDSGIEILLHNLSNPSKALHHLENNVTGRKVGAPATNLVHDLKKRGLVKEDKLNYELNIGARKFKCTTIPIFREEYGLVGAICINVDYNYLNEAVRKDEKVMNAFIDSLLKTDMQLDENILSPHEFELAQAGKRHFRDFEVNAPAT